MLGSTRLTRESACISSYIYFYILKIVIITYKLNKYIYIYIVSTVKCQVVSIHPSQRKQGEKKRNERVGEEEEEQQEDGVDVS